MLSKKFLKSKDSVQVTFELDRGDLVEAALVCETNGWQPQPMPKANNGKGPFRLKVELPKGREVEFRYLIDGNRWENDEAADGYRPNEFGSDNSVVWTAPNLV